MTESPRTPVAVAAARLRCTEGQLYTMVIGLTVALLLAVPGLPAVLRDRSVAETLPSALRPSTREPAAAPSTPRPHASADEHTPVRGHPASGPDSAIVGGRVPRAPALTGSASGPAARHRMPGTIEVFARVGPPGAPGGLAIGTDGTVYVTTDNGAARGAPGPSRVFAYDAAGALVGSRAVSGQSSDRDGGLTGAAVDPASGQVAVLDPGGRRVRSVDMASGTETVLTEIPDLPACLLPLAGKACQPGVVDRPPSADSATYDGRGSLYFTDPAQDTIWRLAKGATTPEAWYQSLDFTIGDGPSGLGLRDGAVTFTVGASNDVATLGSGAVYRLTLDRDGSPARRTLVRAFARDDRPGAVAVADDGTSYVVLRATGTIVAVGADGSEQDRIEPPGSGPVALDTPSALVLSPGALLVANGWASDDQDRWAVLALTVGAPVSASGADRTPLLTARRGPGS